MAKVKILDGSWKDQIGEFVRAETDAAEEVVAIIARMAGGRLVEFKPENVEAVGDELPPVVEPEKAAE